MIIKFIQSSQISKTQAENMVTVYGYTEEIKCKLTENTLYVFKDGQMTIHNLVK